MYAWSHGLCETRKQEESKQVGRETDKTGREQTPLTTKCQCTCKMWTQELKMKAIHGCL